MGKNSTTKCRRQQDPRKDVTMIKHWCERMTWITSRNNKILNEKIRRHKARHTQTRRDTKKNDTVLKHRSKRMTGINQEIMRYRMEKIVRLTARDNETRGEKLCYDTGSSR